MEVVYSGTREREAARAQQRTPAPTVRLRGCTKRILAHLREVPDATILELVAAAGQSQHAVNGALYQLVAQGRVEYAERTATSTNGRQCRSYRLTQKGRES